MVYPRLLRFLTGTLRGRLIVGVALVHAVMMSLFITDLVRRQRATLLERQAAEAVSLSQTLATSAAGWIAADDIAGLQELVEAQRKYPEITFVILADRDGRVLACTDQSKRGQYIMDLPVEIRRTILSRTPQLVDAAFPATIGPRHVGWARVGVGQSVAGRKLARIAYSGALYAAVAVLIGSAIAWFMGRRITQRLYVVQETMEAVRSGDRQARAPESGDDEVTAIAGEFNSMLNTLDKRDADLVASERRFRSLIDRVQTAIILHDGHGRVLDSNPLAQRILESTADQMLGKTPRDRVWRFLREDGSLMPVEEYPISLVLASHQPLRGYVMGVPQKNGNDVTWALVNAEPEIDSTGHILWIVVSFVDISDRKLAERVLEARVRLLDFAASHSMDELLTATLDELERLTGSSVSFYHFLESDQKTLSLQAWSTNTVANMCQATGKGSHYDIQSAGVWGDCVHQRHPVIHNDYLSLPHRKGLPEGHAPVTREAVVPITRGDRIVAIIGVGNKCTEYIEQDIEIVSQLGDLSWDIAERKRAEQELKELSARNEALLGAVPDVVMEFDADHTYTWANAAGREFFGNDVLGTRVDEYVDGGWNAVADIESLFRGAEGTVSVESKQWRQDGRKRILTWQCRGLTNAAGKTTRVLYTARDVTARRQAEGERERLIAELEQRNAELERFSYTVSHDLKTPLITIGGLVGLLRRHIDEQDADKAQSDMTRIGHAVNRMSGLMAHLLEMSRIGRTVNPVASVNLDDVVADAVDSCGGKIAERQVEIRRTTDSPVVMGDRARLNEVLQNLLDNAIKYMGDQPHPVVEITCCRLPAGGLVMVKDNGLGIDHRFHERVFDLFEQLDPKAEGSGVGLALAKRIIECHHGRIWVQSEGCGKGSTFCFTVPNVAATEEAHVIATGRN